MIELYPQAYSGVAPLFAPLMDSQMFCAGVLTGLYPGRVFVDAADTPTCGFAAKDSSWWFIAGDPSNDSFVRALNAALFDGTVGGEKGWGGMLVCDSAAWDARVPELFAPHIPNSTTRLHYVCRGIDVDWQAQTPDGFEIRFIDETLAADGIEAHGAAADVLALRAGAVDPDRRAVGFAAVHDGRIVASSVIDCIVGTGGDIGLFTDSAFRRRGLAFVTAAAALEYALSHGLEVVHWDCQSFNAGSVRTAEKLGLALSHSHTMHTLIFNPVIHDVNRAWARFEAGDYDRAATISHQQIAAAQPQQAHIHFPYLLARCSMSVGTADEAIDALRRAADAGWNNPAAAAADFAPLASHSAWDSIMAKIRENAAPRE